MTEPFDNAAWERANFRIRIEHRLDLNWVAGGVGWVCSCGKEGWPKSGYPSEAVALARGNRHLRAIHAHIYSEEKLVVVLDNKEEQK